MAINNNPPTGTSASYSSLVQQNNNQLTATNTQYPSYNFQNMYLEQSGKNTGKVQRFSLTVPGFPAFNAHLDPNHITDEQAKRIVTIDTLEGIVAQDFGYHPEKIELRGTTGAAYYTEIQFMNNVFNSQSNNSTPTMCQLVIEGRTYSGVWATFDWDRQAQENIYRYSIGFIVLQANKAYNTSSSYNSSQIASQSVSVSNQFSNGQATVQTINNLTGQSARQYVTSLTPNTIPAQQTFTALNFIAQNWPPSNGRPYPGPNAPLRANETLVVPQNWSAVLGASVSASPGVS